MSREQDAISPEEAKHAALALFARRVSHDLNNYAAVIRAYSELVLADLSDPIARQDLGEIREAANSLVEYLRRVARFTRVGSARPSRVLADAAVAEVLESLQDEEPQVPVFLRGGTRLEVLVDVSWFSDVVRELVRNAREASPDGAPVVVQVRSEADAWAVVCVTDAGPGFADEVAANAEDPFVTTKYGVRGAGFGLTLASAFARHAGGKIVREREDGRTSVSIWLPAV
jgi:signal transduction histidine kinase